VRSPGSQNLGLVVASVEGMWSRNQIQTIKLPLTLALLLFVVGCQSRASASSTGSTPPPPSVSVLDVELGDAPIYRDYAAQTFARDMVEVRGRVDGYIDKRLFTPGSTVKAGQPLYVLDARPYQADVAKAKGDVAQAEAAAEFSKKQVALTQAEADLAQAEANLLKAKLDVERLEPLVKEDAAARQDLDNALAALQANQANVKAKTANVEQTRLSTRTQVDSSHAQLESNRALLRTAELNLEYSTIAAPITGLIGDSLVQVGGLVTKNSSQALTTIVPLDPIWVRFNISEAEYLEYQQRFLRDKTELPLDLILADGTTLPYKGRIQNAANQVDPKTGTLELQATFSNPQRSILPGQFGRVRLKIADKHNAILVPQRSVQETQGLQSVLTIDSDHKVVARPVTTGERVEDGWIIENGLKAGDRVIVDGVQKARPGIVVAPKPYVPATSLKPEAKAR